MAVYPNAMNLFYSPGRHFGRGPGEMLTPVRMYGERFNCFVSETFSKSGSIPDGYALRALTPPITGCNLSSFSILQQSQFTAALLQGGPVTGYFQAGITSQGDLGLTVTLAGESVIFLVGDGTLKLTSGLDGSFLSQILAEGFLAVTIPVDGTFTANLVGTGDLRMKLSLEGQWTPYTELSPENLAAAVWNALAEMFNKPGTMGQKLNSAASAGDPWVTELPGNYTGDQAGSIIGRELLRIKHFLALK